MSKRNNERLQLTPEKIAQALGTEQNTSPTDRARYEAILHHADQIAYKVEKFVPSRCPKCKSQFKYNRGGASGYLLFEFWRRPQYREVEASLRAPGLFTELIQCGSCWNITLRVKVEDRICEDPAEAEKALDQGFCNLVQIGCSGSMQVKGVRIQKYIPDVDDGNSDRVVPGPEGK